MNMSTLEVWENILYYVMWYFNVLFPALSFSWHMEQCRHEEVKMLT